MFPLPADNRKSAESVLLFKKKDFPKTRSLLELARQAGVLQELRDTIAFADADYTMARYSNAAGKLTRKLYGRKTFKERLASAHKALELIKKWINDLTL